MTLLTIYSVHNVELVIPSAHGNNATTLSKDFVSDFDGYLLVQVYSMVQLPVVY